MATVHCPKTKNIEEMSLCKNCECCENGVLNIWCSYTYKIKYQKKEK